MSNVVSLVSVLIAFAALGIGVWQVRRNARMVQNTNALPIIADMFDKVRSTEFRDHLNRLTTQSPGDPPEQGFDGLPDPWRESAYAVSYFYDYLGILAAYRIVDDRLIIAATGTHVIRMWEVLRPYIECERSWRERTYPPDASPGFLRYFEHLVARNGELGGRDAPRKIQLKIGVRELPARRP